VGNAPSGIGLPLDLDQLDETGPEDVGERARRETLGILVDLIEAAPFPEDFQEGSRFVQRLLDDPGLVEDNSPGNEGKPEEEDDNGFDDGASVPDEFEYPALDDGARGRSARPR
jgi:hypothetical protein